MAIISDYEYSDTVNTALALFLNTTCFISGLASLRIPKHLQNHLHLPLLKVRTRVQQNMQGKGETPTDV